MKKRNQRVLVLNVDFTPMSVSDWKEAIVGIFKHHKNYKSGVEAVDFYRNDSIRDTAGRHHPIPSVVRTLEYVKGKTSVPFSRKNVFIRDRMTCQYCYKVFEVDELNFDHVICRAKWDHKNGSPTNWTNIVSCCKPCNNRKADKTLKECGMKLLKQPTKPSPHLYIAGLSPWSQIPFEWISYLPETYTVYLK